MIRDGSSGAISSQNRKDRKDSQFFLKVRQSLPEALKETMFSLNLSVSQFT